MGTSVPARLLDLTRLVSRVGRGPWTGIDRVERAYLDAVIDADAPAFGLVRTVAGQVLLDQAGLNALAARLDGRVPWGRSDPIGWLSRKISPVRRRAEADVRRLGLGFRQVGRLGAFLAERLPAGTAYLNVGHTNLTDALFSAVRGIPDATISVLVHDTIPFDHPDLQRAGTPEEFRTRLLAVSQHADRVICTTEAAKADIQCHLTAFGRVPEMLVAPLGVTPAMPDRQALPPGLDLDHPYFVTLGTIEPRKNIGFLLDVWEGLDPRPTLYLVGARGWADAALFDRITKAEGVVELGPLPDGAVAALVQAAKGSLFPSVAEGYGLPPVESLLLGTPVLCAPLPVYRETIAASGIYADPLDVYLWRNEIQNLAQAAPRAGQDVVDRRRRLPSSTSWKDHFNLVFRLT